MKKIFAAIKLIYLVLCYWIVGLTIEEYCVSKAYAWITLKCYRRAIRNFNKALKEGEVSYLRHNMAWCYAMSGMHEEALNHYRRAYEKKQDPQNAIGLAYAEFNNNNLQESIALINSLKKSESIAKLDTAVLEGIAKLELLISKRANK